MRTSILLLLSYLLMLVSSTACPGNTLLKCYPAMMEAVSGCSKTVLFINA